MYLADAIAPRSSSSKLGTMPVLEGDTSLLEGAVSKGEGRATLRLKKDGQAVVEEVVRNLIKLIMYLSKKEVC